MIRTRSIRLRALTAAALLAAGWTGAARADCLRTVYNRSGYVLVVNKDGGPGVTVRPGRSVPVRLSQPGRLDLVAYCPAIDRFGRAVPGGGEAARISLDYEAVIDRCFMKIGDGFFQRDLGQGFFGTKDTAPFTANNPRQGDVVLGPFRAACPAQ